MTLKNKQIKKSNIFLWLLKTYYIKCNAIICFMGVKCPSK